MATRPPHGNLTAALVVVATLELVMNRLIGHLFATPSCLTLLGCVILRSGPFLLYLTGVLALIVVSGGIAGHLLRGELFPRGMRITIGALSMVFLILLAASLLAGQAPARYETHLQTSFGFVTAMVTLAFSASRAAGGRARLGLVLFATPPLLHVASFVASRAVWWSHAWPAPETLTVAGEVVLLVAAVASPVLLLPPLAAWNRLGPALGLAAGVGTFFFVASVGRPDLVQAIGLYGLHLDLPRASSLLGLGYTVALFGYTVTLVSLLLAGGASRLSGLGLALLGLGGYQTASPVELSLTLGGIVVLATGLSRTFSGNDLTSSLLSLDGWRALIESLAAKLSASAAGLGPESRFVEIIAGDLPGTDVAIVRVTRGARPLELVAQRRAGVVEDLKIVVGQPPQAATPDTTIESHETWLGRPPAERPAAERQKTGDLAFDRRWGVYGRLALTDPDLRRRWLRHMRGTIRLWTGVAAENVVTTVRVADTRPGAAQSATALQAVTDVVDLLADLVASDEVSQSPSTPSPSASS
ncbi:MAG TPA: hypothetical protein VGP07_04620 [Polyangia bacterium]|jgi:hypothetical protein